MSGWMSRDEWRGAERRCLMDGLVYITALNIVNFRLVLLSFAFLC